MSANLSCCFDCGRPYLTEVQLADEVSAVTVWQGECCLCREVKSVTHIRHFNNFYPYTLVIAGGRDFDNIRVMFDIIETYVPADGKAVVITGGAPGADTVAKNAFDYYKIKNIVIRAEWEKYGKSAGPRRNGQMASMARSLFAIWDGKSGGTLDMIKQAKKFDLQCVVFDYHGNKFPDGAY